MRYLLYKLFGIKKFRGTDIIVLVETKAGMRRMTYKAKRIPSVGEQLIFYYDNVNHIVTITQVPKRKSQEFLAREEE
jgi:hypothetical protein